MNNDRIIDVEESPYQRLFQRLINNQKCLLQLFSICGQFVGHNFSGFFQSGHVTESPNWMDSITFLMCNPNDLKMCS